jgi:uncharacterized membrane protein YdjX (TVP38/TMEM64 family)
MSNYFHKAIFIIILILPAIIFQVFLQKGLLEELIIVLKNNLNTYIFLILITKILGVLYPPFPGTLTTFSAIPIIGWQQAYLLDFIGSFLGSSLVFYLGRKFGLNLITNFLGKKIAEKIKKIKLKKRNQIESAIIVRFASIGVLSDGVVWGASIWGFEYRFFIIGYMIAHLISTVPLFLLVGLSVSISSWLITLIIAIVAWGLLYRLKGRYFE